MILKIFGAGKYFFWCNLFLFYFNLTLNAFLCVLRHEKRLWFFTLLSGTCMLYSTRTTMPLLVPSVAAELKWTKTDSGTVLSSFFWGYTLTQVI